MPPLRTTRLWFERKFVFDLPLDSFANVVERLRDAPRRAEWRLRAASPAAITAQPADGDWSALENLGHLLDLEELWETRIDQILSGDVETMAPADLENRKTHAADHNARGLDAVLEEFVVARRRILDRLEGRGEADFAKTALHPRLKQPMRLLDLCVFVAEHDDHHIATMAEALRRTEEG